MKNFKPSGVDWIGDIPAHWQIIKLKFAAKNFVEKKSYVGGVYVGMEHVESWTGKISYPEGKIEVDSVLNSFAAQTILFGKLNPYLAKVARPDRVGQCSTEFLTLLPRDGVDKNFLSHTLISKGFIDVVNSSAYGVKMPRSNWNFIGNMRIPLPPFDEQEKIAAYLDRVCGALDREIKIQRALIEKLRVYKKSLISETVTGGLNPNVQKKFSGVDWLGDIPAHWQLIKLKFVARNNIETLSERTAGDTPIKYIDIGSVDYSDGVKKIQEFIFEDAPTRARRVLHEGDTIISTVRTYLKAIAYIEKIFDGHIGSTGFAVLTPREKIFGKFLYYAVSSAPFIGAVEANSFGVSYPAVNDSILKNLKFALPPRDEQKKIAAFLDRKCQHIDENISKRTALVERLTEYKKSLIYEVVTGKREV